MCNVLVAKEFSDLWTCSSYLDVDTFDLLAIKRCADRKRQKSETTETHHEIGAKARLNPWVFGEFLVNTGHSQYMLSR